VSQLNVPICAVDLMREIGYDVRMIESITIQAVKLGTEAAPPTVTASQTVKLDRSQVPELTRNLYLTGLLPMYEGPEFDLIVAANQDETFTFRWDSSVELKFHELCRERLIHERAADDA
jgi:hypothetical protein